MTYGPILRRELRAASLRRSAFFGRVVVAVVLALMLVVPALSWTPWRTLAGGVYEPDALKSYGTTSFIALAVVLTCALLAAVPALVGVAVPQEWERGTMPDLLLTRLTRLEIILVKLAGRLTTVFGLALGALPLLAVAGFVSGLPWEVLGLGLAVVVSTTLTAGAIAAGVSAGSRVIGNGRGLAALTVMFWVLIPPSVVVMPIPAPPPWDVAVRALKDAAAVVAPTSPLSLAMNRAWAQTRGPDALALRVLTLVLGQAALGVLALAFGVWSLARVEPRPVSNDPYRGFRPRCGDDPVYWREFDLPNRTGSAPKFWVVARQFAISLRVLVLALLNLLGLSTIVAVLAALVVGMGWFGWEAFAESRGAGSGTNARVRFNLLTLCLSGVVTFAVLALSMATAASRVTVERDRGSWLILLSTPLTGREILRSKMRALAANCAWPAYYLIALWLTGVACGGATPMGAALAAVNTGLGLWLALALGATIGVRAEPTSAATPPTAVGSLGLGALNAGYAVLALFHGALDPAQAATLPHLPPAADLAFLVGLPAAQGALAWWLTRRLFGRFDEWVDRPRRGTRPGGAGRPTG